MFYCQENQIESLTISKVSTNLALLIDRQVKTTNNTTFEAVSFSDVTFIIHDIYIICFMMIISFFVICVWTGLTVTLGRSRPGATTWPWMTGPGTTTGSRATCWFKLIAHFKCNVEANPVFSYLLKIAPTFSIYLYLVDTDLESGLLINMEYFNKFVMIFNLLYLRSGF